MSIFFPAYNLELRALREAWPFRSDDDRPGAALWQPDPDGMCRIIPITTGNLTAWSSAAAIAALDGPEVAA